MTTPETTAEAPTLFFGDARACKAWLNGLPVSNPAQAQATLLDALRVFNRATFDPLERLKCLELLRDRNAFMVSELRSRHFAKSLPLSPNDATAWTSTLHVLEELEAGYRKCLGEGALDEHAALISQRVIRYIGAQMLLHAAIYRPFDGALWARLHNQYATAEGSGVAAGKVKDSLESEAGSSVMEAYAQVVLLHAAGLHEMTPAQVLFTEAILRQWIRKVEVLGHAPEESTGAVLPLVVDLAQSRGAEPALREALGSAQRVIDVEGLSRSIRRRLRALSAGEDVATLGLPAEVSGVDPLQSLQRLAKRWGEPASRAPMAASAASGSAGLVHGLADIHFFLSGGKAFEQPGKERELTHQEKNDIAVFGRVTERTQSTMAAAGRTQAGHATPPQTFTVEPWDVVEEAVDSVRLRRRASANRSVAIGRVVALRRGDTGPLMVGAVRGIWNEPGGMVMSVATFPGRPEPIAVRGSNPAWVQGVVLPAVDKLGVPRSLLVPSGVAFRGRPVFAWEGEAKQAKIVDILERGTDFDRVTVA
jgi:cyclic-di-GMP-binding protein